MILAVTEIRNQKRRESYKANPAEKERTKMREQNLTNIFEKVMTRPKRFESPELVSQHDLRLILKQLQGRFHGKDQQTAQDEVDRLLTVIWDQFLAVTFDKNYLISNEDGSQQ